MWLKWWLCNLSYDAGLILADVRRRIKMLIIKTIKVVESTKNVPAKQLGQQRNHQSLIGGQGGI